MDKEDVSKEELLELLEQIRQEYIDMYIYDFMLKCIKPKQSNLSDLFDGMFDDRE